MWGPDLLRDLRGQSDPPTDLPHRAVLRFKMGQWERITLAGLSRPDQRSEINIISGVALLCLPSVSLPPPLLFAIIAVLLARGPTPTAQIGQGTPAINTINFLALPSNK